MQARNLTKDLLLTWARRSLELTSQIASARNELAKEPAAMQELEKIVETEMGTPAKRREVALRMALAEHQVAYEHL